jgi:hypothetical protein
MRENDSGDQENTAPDAAPWYWSVQQSKPTARRPDRDERDRSRCLGWSELTSYQKLTTVLTVISLLVASGVAYIYCGQMLTMQAQLAAQQKQLRAAGDTVTLTRWTDEQSLRAWLLIDEWNKLDYPIVPDEVVQVRVQNSGRSPALRMAGRIEIRAFGHDKFPESPPYPPIPRGSLGSVGPSQFSYLGAATNSLRPEEVDAINRGDAQLYAYGWLDYRDPFNTPRGLFFCAEFAPARKMFLMCPSYNLAW